MSAAPEGFTYLPDFLSTGEHDALVPRLRALPFGEVRFRGVIARRKVVHLGLLYGYESWRLDPGPPIPPWLEPLRGRCAALLGEAPERLEEALVTLYPPGAGIGWHRDAPSFGPAVVGVSFAGSCRMRFQRGEGEARKTWAATLAPRSAYVLAGPARATWQHSIPAGKEERLSVTFRTVRRRTGRAASR